MKHQLILTSTSEVKYNAVQAIEFSSASEINTCKTKTYIEQPWTQEQTYGLNMLRVAEALSIGISDPIISIESGIDIDAKGYYDFANVILYFNRENIWSFFSEYVYIPEEFNTIVDVAVRSQETVTFGKLLSEKYPTYDPKNWQEHFGLSRSSQIITALQKIKDLGVL